jgi:hypothetical protein
MSKPHRDPAGQLDRELEQYRNLMLPPGSFEEGFRWSSLLGAVFIALLMVPGAMYMNLVAGMGVGPAAQWVTVILFIEVARRAHKRLARPELFILFYMASAVMAATPYGQGLLWNQYFVQSQAAYAEGVAQKIPSWFAPTATEVLDRRSFMCWEWMPAIGLFAFGMIMSRINPMILGYGLFRVASDIEKLPFPMAPVGAQGIMALAEQSEEERKTGEDSWRWRVFSIGGILGLAFGTLYMGLPIVTGALLKKPISLFPIPFSDWTKKTQDFLPAVATGLDWNLSNLIWGMVLPFFAMLGSFIALILTMIGNPILYRLHILNSWITNDETIKTTFKNNVDFYFSFSIGLAIAIALVGFWQVYRGLRRRSAARQAPAGAPEAVDARQADAGVPGKSKRGDLPTSLVIATYLISTCAYIVVSGFLINWHPGVMIALLFFGFVYTPLISYVTARMEGIAGQVVDIPMIREAAFIWSGYSGGVAVWFLPVPIANYGTAVVQYRTAELTGTRFVSIWKAELVLLPVVLVASLFFSNFIWSLAEVPSARYPYAQVFWELGAANNCIIYSSTLGRFSRFEQALSGWYIGAGSTVGVLLFVALMALRWPLMLFYGLVRGLNQTLPHVVVPQFIGALLGRFYFERKMGLKWRQYVPVVAAGFSCGMGLISVLCVGVTFLAKAVVHLPY